MKQFYFNQAYVNSAKLKIVRLATRSETAICAIARGTLSGLLLLLLCCWNIPRLNPRVTWRLEVQAAVIGSTSVRFH
jgi:hypothetical protein